MCPVWIGARESCDPNRTHSILELGSNLMIETLEWLFWECHTGLSPAGEGLPVLKTSNKSLWSQPVGMEKSGLGGGPCRRGNPSPQAPHRSRRGEGSRDESRMPCKGSCLDP